MTAVSLLVSIVRAPHRAHDIIICRRKDILLGFYVTVLFPLPRCGRYLIDFNGIQTVRVSMQEHQQPSRSEPSSRTFLNGEQPYAWDLISLLFWHSYQYQTIPSSWLYRHRYNGRCKPCYTPLQWAYLMQSPKGLQSVVRGEVFLDLCHKVLPSVFGPNVEPRRSICQTSIFD